MTCKSYKLFFETISNDTRLAIIECLQKKEMSVNEICECLDEEQSKISHNLKKLADCNFIDVKQEGKKRIYSVNKDTIVPLMELVRKHVHHFCGQECKRQGE
jgi:DNA-binding transcriptional ArsR family regulator